MTDRLIMRFPTPVFQHDCEHCVYIGAGSHEGRFFDAFIHKAHDCDSPVHDDIIARFSSDGPDYVCSKRDLLERYPHPVLSRIVNEAYDQGVY